LLTHATTTDLTGGTTCASALASTGEPTPPPATTANSKEAKNVRI
jgi:hypothetical protein